MSEKISMKAHLEKLAGHDPEVFGLEGPVDDAGFYAVRPLPLTIPDDGVGGHWLVVEPSTFKRARLAISLAAAPNLSDAIKFGYADVWDYPSRAAALEQLETWNGIGEPEHWSRHAHTGRRRQKDGSIKIRMGEIDSRLIAHLRQQIAEGAGHECSEWQGEHGRCLLCDSVNPEKVERDPMIVLTDFVGRGKRAQLAVDQAIADAEKK